MSRRSSSRAAVSALAALLILLPAGARAQEDVLRLRERCSVAAPSRDAHCLEAALAAQAIQGAVGLSLAGGSDLPGAPSTMGRRLGTTPRVGLSLRIGGHWADAPDVARDPELPTPGEGFFTGSVEGRVAVGALHGFSPLPTVGGILSLDLLGSVGVVLLPSSFGFGSDVASVGLGARVGLLRESFALPGVSVSAVRRWAGGLRLGRSAAPGDGTRVDVDPAVTSVRALVGKDLLAVGLLAGIGWDRYSGSARVRVSPDSGTPPTEAGLEDFKSDRILYFGGFSMTYLVLQLSAEAGWTGGYFDLPSRGGELYAPSDGAFFGSVALRLTI